MAEPSPPIHDREQAIKTVQGLAWTDVGGLVIPGRAEAEQIVDALGIGQPDPEVERRLLAFIGDTQHPDQADYMATNHNAGTVKVQPGYESTVEAKHRADERLWAVLSDDPLK